jgi:SCF-associated factor 1
VRHHNLRFPAGFPYSTALAAYEEPTIAIQQFSSGRSHILGLSDSGRIWSWYNARKPALHVKFLNVDLTEASSGKISPTNSPLYGRVKQIVAGWSRSSAYIYGTGIVVWDIASRPREDENEETDTMLVMEHAEVPKTGYQRIKGASRDTDEDRVLSQEIGAVLNYIILESYVVFVTDIGRVFCGRFGEKHLVEDIVELRALRNDTGTPSDIQGTFRRFAIFRDGEVITTDQAYLDACWNARHQDTEQTGIQGLRKIPALQHNDVISVAFGDYHFLALHANGKITSYGTELQACGALGLGGNGDPEGRTRGVRYSGFSNDGKLVPHAYTHGRQVWFEPEKKKWVTYMTSGGKDPDEAKERMRMFVSEPGVQGELSEWFEQEGRDWDKDPNLKDADDDGLGSYFALSVSAAGWHSGAIVLVNEQLAERVRQNCIIKDPAVEENEEKDGEEEEGEGSSRLVASSLSWLYALGRAFLGLPPTGHPLQDADNHPEQSNDFLDPVTHGASPEKGYLYIWADKSFPRLKLSDEREMPGTVEFDEWRFGRPEWDLSIDDV